MNYLLDETEEDYQILIDTLLKLDVKVVRAENKGINAVAIAIAAGSTLEYAPSANVSFNAVTFANAAAEELIWLVPLVDALVRQKSYKTKIPGF